MALESILYPEFIVIASGFRGFACCFQPFSALFLLRGITGSNSMSGILLLLFSYFATLICAYLFMFMWISSVSLQSCFITRFLPSGVIEGCVDYFVLWRLFGFAVYRRPVRSSSYVCSDASNYCSFLSFEESLNIRFNVYLHRRYPLLFL